MTTQNPFEVATATENTFNQFNAFESAAPSALKEFPRFVPETPSTVTDSLAPPVALYDSSQTQPQPFEITDGSRVIASDSDCESCDDGACDDGPSGGCPCCDYRVTGWNRNNSFVNNRFSSCSDGSCSDDSGDEGDDYYPEDDGGDCGPDGDCGPGGGLLRGLLARFGRGALFGRLFGGGGLGFGRGFFGRF